MTTAAGELGLQGQLERYAAVAWQPDDVIEVRALPTQRDGGPRPMSFWTRAEELPKCSERMEALNAGGLNIYAGILPRKAEGGTTDADCLGGWVVWADFDGQDPRTCWTLAAEKKLPNPSMVVNSGHGTHLFWALKERVDATEVSELVKDLAHYLGSDPHVANPSRILRLPGLMNLKEPPAKCVLLYAKPDDRQDFAYLRYFVPSAGLQDEQPRTPKPKTPVAQEDVIERARRYVATIEGSGPGGRRTKAYKVAVVLVNDFALGDSEALSILAGWDSAANRPPIAESYGHKELETLLRNARRYAKRPAGEKAQRKDYQEPSRLAIPVGGGTDISDMRRELEAQQRGERRTIELPWPRLSSLSQALRPGTLFVLAGPAGVGKSFKVLNIAKGVHDAGIPWSYLPLEDRKVDLEFRFLALLARDYRMIDEDASGAEARRTALETHAAALADIAQHLSENPRIGQKDRNGKTVVPPVPYQAVLDYVAEALKTARVVFIDPISQIDFDGPETWQAEADFIRRSLALVSDSGGTLCLVAHTVKRTGRDASAPLTMEDIQGSAQIGRLCHCALILDAHDVKTSAVYREHGTFADVEHNRTVLIAKARNAPGGRQRIAFLQRADSPTFEELGVIAPKNRGEA
ncbi:MAG: hypothetical protein FJ278_00430 [Planctomycetes bacterium]|nr:hypothetical protein [Planctomycetota bacterium]